MSFRYDLTQLRTRSQLIDFLGLDDDIFELVLTFEETPSPLSIPIFFKHEIPKRNGRGHRTVWETFLLKSHYKALARRLTSFLSFKLSPFPHPRTFGYVGGRNIKENAQDHCGHKHLISVDLKDFFPSISAQRVESLFLTLGIEPTVAEPLGRFITISGKLPLGLATSPIIANAICLPMDKDLHALAQKTGAVFSRYADDISFSSNGMIPLQDEIALCIQKHGFNLAPSKTQQSKLGQAHYVTGLSVSDSAQPHVPRGKKRRLRQEFYYAKKHGLDDHFHRIGINDSRAMQHEVNRLDGLVKFVAYHEPRFSARLKSEWRTLLVDSGNRPSFEPKKQIQIPFCIFIDETEYTHPDGRRILALAMAASQHQDRVNRATQANLDSILSDVWAAGNLAAVAKKGLHFADVTEDARLKHVELMRTLPFEGYVAMAHIPSPEDYEATYLKLLKAMISRRLMAAESQFAYIVFEQNGKVSQEAIKKIVTEAHDTLRKTHNRHPIGCTTSFVGKPCLGIVAPDFLLGVLGKYLASKPEAKDSPVAREKLMFERIRDKYRLILDADSRMEYSRRRPIAPWLG